MATQLEVECPVCKRVVKLIGNEIISNHRSPKTHRQCAGSEQRYETPNRFKRGCGCLNTSSIESTLEGTLDHGSGFHSLLGLLQRNS